MCVKAISRVTQIKFVSQFAVHFFIYMNQLHLKDVHEQSNISWSVEGLHTEVGEGWWTTVENGRSEENPRRTYVTQCPE